jgi:hypothetical protein
LPPCVPARTAATTEPSSSKQGGEREAEDGAEYLEADDAKAALLMEAADAKCSNSNISTSSDRNKHISLKGLVSRLAAMCSITALIWAVFASGDVVLRVAAGFAGDHIQVPWSCN